MFLLDILFRAKNNILRNKARNLLLLISMSLGIASLMIMIFVGSSFESEIMSQYKKKNDLLTSAFYLKNDNDIREVEKLVSAREDKVKELKYYHILCSDNNITIDGKETEIRIYSDSKIEETEINKKYYELYGLSPVIISNEDKSKAPEKIKVLNINEELENNIPWVIIPERIKESITGLKVRDIIVQIKCNNEKASEEIRTEFKKLGYNIIGDYSILSKKIEFFKYSLVVIGLVALIISLITISNTIAVAMEERGKEIEILKILGAKNQTLVSIFIAEFFSVGVVSAAFGTILSLIISFILNVIYKAMGISELFNIYRISRVSPINIFIGIFISLFIIFITVFIVLKSDIKKSYLEVLKEE